MGSSSLNPTQLSHPDGSKVAYAHLSGAHPGILFCGGFNSNMQGSKALAMEAACKDADRQFTRFDYRGHGVSSGSVEDHVVSDWLADAEMILEQVATGPQVIVGSSMGAWIACLLIKKHPQRFVGFVSIAGAPDFTEDIMLPKLNDMARKQLAAGEIVWIPTPYDEQGYPITQGLIDDGRINRVLTTNLPVSFPVRLLHGTEDESVPWQQSIRLMEVLQGDDIQLELMKGGEHRLSEPSQLVEIIRQTFALLP